MADTESWGDPGYDEGDEEQPRDVGNINRDDVRKVYAAMQALHDDLIAKRRAWDGFMANEHIVAVLKSFRQKTLELNLALKDCKRADFDADAAMVNARISLLKEFENPFSDSDIEASEKKLGEFHKQNALFLQEFDKPPKRTKK